MISERLLQESDFLNQRYNKEEKRLKFKLMTLKSDLTENEIFDLHLMSSDSSLSNKYT